MQYLFVLAHPDDECDVGATIRKLVDDGNQVAVVIMVSQAAARRNLSESLAEDENESMRILGVQKVFHGEFPNIQMNTLPHSQIVHFIGECMKEWKAEAIITHHPTDVNNDHAITSFAVQTACKLMQESVSNGRLKLLLYMESTGATEWSLDNTSKRFFPNYFVEIGKEGIKIKNRAMASYGNVVRPYPHPSSRLSCGGLAAFRGAQAGCNYAEAFECAFRRV